MNLLVTSRRLRREKVSHPSDALTAALCQQVEWLMVQHPVIVNTRKAREYCCT